MKNIKLVKNKLNKFIETVNTTALEVERNEDDMKYLIIKAAEFSDDLEVMELGIKLSEGHVNEKDFKDGLNHINSFINDALELLENTSQKKESS